MHMVYKRFYACLVHCKMYVLQTPVKRMLETFVKQNVRFTNCYTNIWKKYASPIRETNVELLLYTGN